MKWAKSRGKGAVKDTYNLLADGIEQLACRLGSAAVEAIDSWADKQDLSRYFGSTAALFDTDWARGSAAISLHGGAYP